MNDTIEKTLPETTAAAERIFTLGGRGWRVRGQRTADGFVIFAGSTVHEICESFKREASYYPLRLQIESEGVIADGKMTRDYCFKSPGQAGAVVACRTIATNTEWKTDDDDAMTWGEMHPRLRGEAETDITFIPIQPRRKPRRIPNPPEGYSRDRHGTQIYFRTNSDGSTLERRGHVCGIGFCG